MDSFGPERTRAGEPEALETHDVELHARVDRAIAAWPVGEVAAGWFPLGLGHGASGRPGPVSRAGSEVTTFAWASVTKLVTALAVLVAVEEGTTALDEPAGPPGSTVRHLLAHASGLGPEPGPPVCAPGKRRVYSNAGFVALGDHVAERSGIPVGHYIREAVLEPLGMHGVRMDDPPAGLAAAGLSGNLDDLVRLAHEWARPTVISTATWDEAIRVQWPELGGIVPGFGRFDPCPWGLGPEIRGGKHPHWTGVTNAPTTFGHFGSSGSFLWVDRATGLAAVGLADRPFGPWAGRAWPELAGMLVAGLAPVSGQV